MPSGKPNLSPLEEANPRTEACRVIRNPRATGATDPTGTNRGPNRGIKVLDVEETQWQQVDVHSCAAAALAEGLGDPELQDTIIDLTLEKRGIQPTGPDRPALGKGVYLEELSPILTEAGYVNTPLYLNNGAIFEEIRDAVERDFVVVVALRFPEGNVHSLRIRKFLYGKNGKVQKVRAFDPGPGDPRDIPVLDFRKYLKDAVNSKDLHAAALVVEKR
jgi:hypothetical protein